MDSFSQQVAEMVVGTAEETTFEIESGSCLEMIDETNDIYMKTGSNSRSSKKVDNIHQWIEDKIKPLLPENMKIKQEQFVPSNTKSCRKKCDIVIYKDDEPYIVLPVKYSMTSYYKNSYNYWENMQGELMSLKFKAAIDGNELYIVPINIISNLIPNRGGTGKLIQNMEVITYGKSFEVYETMKKIPSGTMENISPLCFDVISYIIDVEHQCKIGDKYDKDSADYEHQWNEKYNKHKGWMRLDVLRSYEGTNGSSLISHKKSAKNGEGSYANKWPNGEDGDPIIF